ncbi:MAG: S-layer homology domain-containing protein [Proteocatella sp.]
MKRNSKKTLSVGTAIMMVLTTAIPAFADTSSASKFPDVTGHWAAGDLTKMTERGIMGGYPDGTMKPEKAVTMAESIKLINKALDLKGSKGTSVITYSDVKKDAWYSDEIAIAVENGYLSKVAPGMKLNPNAPATREQLSSMLAEAMKLTVSDTKILDKFKDADQISPALRMQMAAAVEKGLFGGYEDDTIRPKSVVIRATMSAVANRAITEREAAQIKLGVNDVLVDANGTALSNKTFETVLISPVKGEGVITLEKITAKKIIVMGAESSVVIKGESKINEIEYKAANSKLDIQKDAVVNLLTVKAEAKNSTVSGDGILTKVEISAENFKLNTIGTKFIVMKDVDGVTTNGTKIPAGTSGKTTKIGFDKDVVTGGGGGGGGGGSVTPPVSDIVGTGYSYSPSTLTLTVNSGTISSTTLDSKVPTTVTNLVVAGSSVTIDGITVTGTTTVQELTAPAPSRRNIRARVITTSNVTFTNCKIETLVLNRTGVNLSSEGGSIGSITVTKTAAMHFKNCKITKLTANAASSVFGDSTSTIKDMVVNADGVDSQIESTNPATGTGKVAPITNYKFSATYDGKIVLLDRIAYNGNDKMSFDIVSDAYDQIKTVDNAKIIIKETADTIKSVLNLKSDKAESYITVLDKKITSNTSGNLTVFGDATVKSLIAELSKTTIDGGIVSDANIEKLATQISRFDLSDILSDLGILFPNSELPSQISVTVMGTDISSRKLSNIKETINADLGAVNFKTANGKEVVKVTIGSKSAALVIAVA